MVLSDSLGCTAIINDRSGEVKEGVITEVFIGSSILQNPRGGAAIIQVLHYAIRFPDGRTLVIAAGDPTLKVVGKREYAGPLRSLPTQSN